jgi:hypothetical protein
MNVKASWRSTEVTLPSGDINERGAPFTWRMTGESYGGEGRRSAKAAI